MAREKKELEKYSPTRGGTVLDQMDRLFEDFMGRRFGRWWPTIEWSGTEFETGVVPSVDVFDRGDEIVVEAELPGIKKDDIHVDVTGSTLIISGEKKKEEKVEEKDYYRLERSYGSFKRSIRIPAEVQAEKVKATFKDGILEIKMPKTEEAKKKQIKVNIQ